MKLAFEDDETCASSQASHNVPIVTAEDWFARGERVPYDPSRKRILKKETPNSVFVWERVVAPFDVCSVSRWLTMLPGVPDGTYTFSKLDDLVQTTPRLYVEFVGLGNSDKPSKYAHSVKERANLVEAQWKAHKVRRTVLVCQSCSSMVMMELLNRQQERLSLGLPVRTRIEHVLCLNGAYFSHTHKQHPLNTCVVLKNTIGKATMKAAQHSDFFLDPILKSFFSNSYEVTKEELQQIATVVRRHKGMNYFTGSASRYVEDHKAHSERWNLENVYRMTRRQGISFMIVGGEEDPYEYKAFSLAREKLAGKQDIYFETIPGGYNLPLEHPRRVAELIDGVAMMPAFNEELVGGACSSKRSSMASGSDGSTSLSTDPTYLSVSTSSDWADAEFPEMFEYTM